MTTKKQSKAEHAAHVGQIVLYVQPDHDHPINGKREHPAIVTSLGEDGAVNVHVLFDGHTAHARTDVPAAGGDDADRTGYWRAI